MRFIVQFLDFQEKRRKRKFTHLVVERIVFHSLAGMEAIMGGAATQIHFHLERLEQFDKRYLRKYLVLRSKDLSGMTDLLHHKELHRIYRLHSIPGRKSRMDDCVSNCNSSYSNQSSIFTSRRKTSAMKVTQTERNRRKNLMRYSQILCKQDSSAYKPHRRNRNSSTMRAIKGDPKKNKNASRSTQKSISPPRPTLELRGASSEVDSA